MTEPIFPNLPVHVIGAGLAGSEATWQIVRRGIPVILHEMRPGTTSPAHKTEYFAEFFFVSYKAQLFLFWIIQFRKGAPDCFFVI